MTNTNYTSINFDYGSYSEDGDWIRTESHMYCIMIVEPFEETTYERLIGKICRKIKVDEATANLKLTYTKLEVNGLPPMVILDDEDVLLYVLRSKEGLYSILHVEPLELVKQIRMSNVRLREDRNSRKVVRSEDMICSGRGSNTIYLNTESEPNMLLDEEEYDDVRDVCDSVENTESEQMLLDNVCEEEEDRRDDLCGGVEIAPIVDGNQIIHVVDGQITPTVEGKQIANHKWADGIDMKIGQEFESKRAVQDLIEKAAHVNCFSVATKKSTKSVYVLKCGAAACSWGFRLAKLKNSNRFTLRKYEEMHTCSRIETSTSGYKNKGTPRLVASLLHADYPGKYETPTPKSIMGLVQGKLGVSVSYSTAWRGKKQAAANVRGTPSESFQRIPSYLHMLKQVNPGTKTYWECDEDSRFKYLFIALGACIEGFKAMRKVIIMDGTHIKTEYGGTLIFALAQDPDHHHYPIAFGVIDGAENHAGWEWFLQKLKISVPDDPDLVFVTDRHASIIDKVMHVYPQALHGYCIYHMGQNVKSHAHNKKDVWKRFKECARVYTEAEFYPLYVDLANKYPKVMEYLTENRTKENKWARCFFPGERYNIDTTNCAESMNAIFLKAREFPLLPMLDAIIGKILEWFNKYRKMSTEVHVSQKLVPRIAAELHNRCQGASLLQVYELNSYLLEYSVIGHDGNCCLVDLRNKSCSCRHFDIDKYPCEHAIAAAMAYSKNGNRLDLHDLCSPYYLIVNWEIAYCKTIYPVPSFTSWDIPQDILEVQVLPPMFKKKKTSGRRMTKRYPSVGEARPKRSRKSSAT